MSDPTKCSVCGEAIAKGALQMPLGGLAHGRCGLEQLTEYPDRKRSLIAWERLRGGKRLGAVAVRTWIASRLRAEPLVVVAGTRGLIILAGLSLVELVPVSSGDVIAFTRGRRLVMRGVEELMALLRGDMRHAKQPAA